MIAMKTLTEVRELLLKREIGCEEATKACLDRIAETEPKLGALLAVDAEGALARARELDAQGPDPEKALWGVPVTIKDVIATKGIETTCASKILKGFVPFYDAELVARMLDAGAVIVGKNNMDEFAMGSTTENSAYKVTKNPWKLDVVPGGSSGGSGASVAAGQGFASIGTDTGGSIRLPAAFCGCVGMKPTYGRVSRYGLIAYGSSLDQAGPLGRSVADVAAVLGVISGHDAKDSTSANVPVPDFEAAASPRADLKGVRLGLPKEYWGRGLDPEIETALGAAVKTAEDLGATIVETSLPHTEYAIATYYIIAMAEASSNLARFDGVRFGHRDKEAKELVDMYVRSRTQGFGDEVQRRIMIGTYVLSAGYYDAYYRKAAQVRRLIRQDYLDAFEHCDVLLAGASPVPAWTIGALTADPLQMYLMDVFTISLNLAGLGGLCLPVGLGERTGLPVGMQIFGKAFDEATVLSVAATLEAALPKLPTPTALA